MHTDTASSPLQASIGFWCRGEVTDDTGLTQRCSQVHQRVRFTLRFPLLASSSAVSGSCSQSASHLALQWRLVIALISTEAARVPRLAHRARDAPAHCVERDVQLCTSRRSAQRRPQVIAAETASPSVLPAVRHWNRVCRRTDRVNQSTETVPYNVDATVTA